MAVAQHIADDDFMVAARLITSGGRRARSGFHLHRARPSAPTVSTSPTCYWLRLALRMAGHVILVFVGVVALVKAIGVATIGQAFQLGQRRLDQTAGRPRRRRSPGDTPGRCAPRNTSSWCGLRSSARNAHLHQPLDMLHRAQVFAVHDVGAMLVFHDRHGFARPAALFDQIHLIGQRMALGAATGGKLLVGAVQRLLKSGQCAARRRCRCLRWPRAPGNPSDRHWCRCPGWGRGG